MEILSRCPLTVRSFLWQPRAGAWVLTVVAKATFRLLPGESPLDALQDEPIEEDSHWDDDQNRSLHLASDMVPRKKRPEVLVVGHAHAPGGAKVASLVARLSIGEVDKAVQVVGDRHFTADGALSAPAKFARMPLRWERAAGGPGTWNPAGVRTGEEARPDGWGRIQVPNLLPAGVTVTRAEEAIPPACFGPIARSWPERARRLHGHAGGWDAARWAREPLPGDFDMGYFNAAPADQMLEELRGDERIVLEHLHPGHAVLATRLAAVRPRALVSFGSGAAHEVPIAADTLLIDSDRAVAALTYRAHVALDHPARQGWVVVEADATPPSEPPLVEETQRIRRVSVPEPPEETLRLKAVSAPEGLSETGILSEETAVPIDEWETVDGVDSRSLALPESAPAPAEPAWLAAHPEPPPQEEPDRAAPPVTTALPFRRVEAAQVGGMALGRSMRLQPPRVEEPARESDVAPAPLPPASPVPPPPPPAFAAMMPVVPPAPMVPVVPMVPVAQPEIAGPVALVTPSVPLAPILLDEPVAEAKPDLPAAAALDAQDVSELGLLPAAEPRADQISLEECAVIHASIERRPAARKEILDSHDLTPADWTAVRARHERGIALDSKRSTPKLLAAYDAAYLEQIERERGPISTEEYARISLASEQGEARAVLVEMGLPAAAELRIHRAWIGKIAADPALGAAVRAALERLRDE